jgi:GNAT superfamily N-acetyltransferase
MPQTPTAKTLMAWRKDAGWSAPVQPHTLEHPTLAVRWVGVWDKRKQVAIARLELAPPEFCYVGDLIIAADFRRRGIGSWFLEAIEKYVGGHGIKRLLLEAEAGSEAFYKAHHFVCDPYVPRFLKKDLSPLQRKMFVPHPAKQAFR